VLCGCRVRAAVHHKMAMPGPIGAVLACEIDCKRCQHTANVAATLPPRLLAQRSCSLMMLFCGTHQMSRPSALPTVASALMPRPTCGTRLRHRGCPSWCGAPSEARVVVNVRRACRKCCTATHGGVEKVTWDTRSWLFRAEVNSLFGLTPLTLSPMTTSVGSRAVCGLWRVCQIQCLDWRRWAS
jgi:hypothetical protein